MPLNVRRTSGGGQAADLRMLIFDDFRGGLNTSSPINRLAPNETPDAENVVFGDRGGVEVRPGLRWQSIRLDDNACEPGELVHDELLKITYPAPGYNVDAAGATFRGVAPAGSTVEVRFMNLTTTEVWDGTAWIADADPASTIVGWVDVDALTGTEWTWASPAGVAGNDYRLRLRTV